MILIVGSTGALGSSVTKGLLASHRNVAAFIRDDSTPTARELRADGASLVVGDLKSRPTIDMAMKGIDTVVCTASSTLSRREGDSIETVDRMGVQDLISASISARIMHFIYVSFSRNIGDDFPLALAKRAAEARLESSAIDYTILLPSYFAECLFTPVVGFDVANGKVRVYGTGKSKVSHVALEDVARAIIACVDNPRVIRKSMPIGGPSSITQLDAVALAERVTGRKVQLEFMSADEIAAARKGTEDSLTASFLGLFDALSKGDEIISEWAGTLGVKLQSMEDWFSARS